MPEPRGPGGPLAIPIFGISINPIPTWGGQIIPLITTNPHKFFHLPPEGFRYHCYWRGLDGRILSKRWGIITNGMNRKRFEISKSILCQWIENYFSSSAWLEKKQFLCKNAKNHFLLKSISINLTERSFQMWVYRLVYQLRYHHYQCALLDLMPIVSCQFGKNRIHFLPPNKPLISPPKN